MKKILACLLIAVMVTMLSSCAVIIVEDSKKTPEPTSDSISYGGNSNSENMTENTRATITETEEYGQVLVTPSIIDEIEDDGNNGNGNGNGGGISDSCPHNIWEENTCVDCGKTCDHNGTEEWRSNSTTHTKVLSCCGMVLEAPELHEIEDGVCCVCNYGN